MKTCATCGYAKAFDDFHRDTAQKDGHHPYCKVCKAAKVKARREADPEFARKKARDWIANNRDKHRASSARYNAANRGATTEWARNNRERHRENNKRWYAENADKVAASARVYYTTNRDRIKAVGKSWQLRNASKLTAASNRRRAIKLDAQPTWLSAIQKAQLQEFYDISDARTMQTGIKHHVDHIHPLLGSSFRGLHVPWNLQVITATENHEKGRRLLDPTCAGGSHR